MTEKQIQYRKALIQRLHAVKASRAMSDECYLAMLSQYNATSSTQLSISQLTECLHSLGADLTTEASHTIDRDLDTWRKRVMGAIGAWISSQGRTANATIIKAIACRAAGVPFDHFNKVSKNKWIRIYNEFHRKTESFKSQSSSL